MKRLKALVLKFLKISEFDQKDGKAQLSDDQLAQLSKQFGKEFAEEFSKYLATEGSSEEKEAQAQLDKLIDALNNHNTAVLQASKEEREKTAQEIAKLKTAIEKLSDNPEPDPEPELDNDIPRAEGLPTVLKVDLSRPHYNATAHFLRNGYMVGAEAATIEVADLASEFGTYLSQGRHNLEEVNAIFQGFTSAQHFTNAMATTEWRGIQALITSVSQQFTNKWTPSGKSKFRPLTIRNRRHKINLPIIPSEVLESYMMHLYDESLAPDQMPITRYIWQQLLFPQLMQDIELRMFFKGKYIDVTNDQVNAGDPGKPPEDSMDGIETILVDSKDGSKNIRYFDGEGFDFTTASDDEILEFVADFVAWMAPLFRTMTMPIFCSFEFYRRYRTAYKNKWGAGSGTQDTEFGSGRIDFSRNTLVPLDGMYNSPILWVTPSANRKKLRHKNDVPMVINDVQKPDYEVRLFGEYWLGTGFAYGEAVFAYVPDDYDPKAEIIKYYGAHTSYQQNKGIIQSSGSGSGSGGGGL